MMDLCEVTLRASGSQPTSVQLRQEVDALSVEERAAVMLVCVKGLSYQDAAQKLGIPRDAVRGHLLRGRLTLLRKLNLAGRKDRDADQKALSPSSS